jgi:multidrug resistance efflux pump
MAADVHPETQTSESRSVPQDTGSDGRWWTRGLFAVVALVLIGTAASFISGATSSDETGPKLTHTIASSDLVVTVTEQGTLESSNNTEIKCKVRGSGTVLWVIEAGTEVNPGDEVVRLDTSTIEENINTQKIAYQRAVATHTQSETDVAVAKIGITEYQEGTFRSSMKLLEKDLAIAESNLRTAKNMYEHNKRMFKRGYVSELEVEGHEFTVTQAQLELELKKTEIDVLERFTKAKEMETLKSALKAAEANLASDKAALDLEKARLDREEEQLKYCVIRAESSGMVIHPSAAEWKERPDIEEGATVRQDQVLLMIPDLSKMQVKVGIHESKVDRVKAGMSARITLQDLAIDGNVSSVASITKPAGWWTGNVVKYDTIIELDAREGLKPGMSAEVVVTLAEHRDVLTIPVAAVVETESEFFCWVKTAEGPKQRSLQLGDSNDQFIVIEGGLKEGDEVVLNPIAFIEEAQEEALKPLDEEKDKAASESDEQSKDAGDAKPKQESKPAGDAKPQESKPAAAAASPGAQILKLGDKNGDGVLTIDEYAEKDKQHFAGTDLNKDGKVDAAELDAVIKKMQEAGAN